MKRVGKQEQRKETDDLCQTIISMPQSEKCFLTRRSQLIRSFPWCALGVHTFLRVERPLTDDVLAKILQAFGLDLR